MNAMASAMHVSAAARQTAGDMRIHLRKFAEYACKPDSVPLGKPMGDGHLSGARVAVRLGAT